MHPMIPLLADLHRDDLLREAELERRARLAREAQPATPRWRRQAGRAFRTASDALATAARRLDPGTAPSRRHLDLAH